jgi:hypothetical protein
MNDCLWTKHEHSKQFFLLFDFLLIDYPKPKLFEPKKRTQKTKIKNGKKKRMIEKNLKRENRILS